MYAMQWGVIGVGDTAGLRKPIYMVSDWFGEEVKIELKWWASPICLFGVCSGILRVCLVGGVEEIWRYGFRTHYQRSGSAWNCVSCSFFFIIMRGKRKWVSVYVVGKHCAWKVAADLQGFRLSNLGRKHESGSRTEWFLMISLSEINK